MKPLKITAASLNSLHVFAVSRSAEDMLAALAEKPLAQIAGDLLGHEAPADKVELFAVSDLAGVGLSGYLIEGQGIPETQIAPDRPKLEALDGFVMLLLPRAFASEVILPGSPDLALIGAYQEPRPEMNVEPIETASAEPYSGTPRLTPAQPPQGRAGSAMVALAVIIAVFLALWWGLS